MAARISAFVPFPVDSLPEPLARYVETVATVMVADPSYVATPLLGLLGGAIGNAAVIRPKQGWTEPAVLWTLIVGPSGTVKSPCIEHCAQAIKAAQAAERKEWEAICKGLDPAEPRPSQTRFWCDDVTLEALASLLKDNPRGLTVIVDEAAGWVKSFGQYKGGAGGDESKWLSIHGARSIQIDRKTGEQRSLYIPRAAVSVVGGIQPRTLAELLTPERFASGFAARLLLAMPPDKPKVWTDAELSETIQAEQAAVFDALLKLKMPTDDRGDQSPDIFTLSPRARPAFQRYYNELNANLPDDERRRACHAKLEGGALRLALIVHCVRRVNQDPSLWHPNAVDETSILAGIELATWFKNEGDRIYALLAQGELGQQRRRLLELICNRGGAMSVRELQRQKPAQYPKSEDAELALQGLVDSGLGTWQQPIDSIQKGRPTKVFALVDHATIDKSA